MPAPQTGGAGGGGGGAGVAIFDGHWVGPCYPSSDYTYSYQETVTFKNNSLEQSRIVYSQNLCQGSITQDPVTSYNIVGSKPYGPSALVLDLANKLSDIEAPAGLALNLLGFFELRDGAMFFTLIRGRYRTPTGIREVEIQLHERDRFTKEYRRLLETESPSPTSQPEAEPIPGETNRPAPTVTAPKPPVPQKAPEPVKGCSEFGSENLAIAFNPRATEKCFVEALNSGVDVNSKGQNGRSPTHVMAKAGRADLVKVLISREVDIHAADGTGTTPIMAAVFTGQAQVVKILIQHGAKTDYKDQQGANFLHWAARQGKTEVAKELVDNIEINAKDNGGLTALDWALKNKHEEMAAFLLSRGAESAR